VLRRNGPGGNEPEPCLAVFGPPAVTRLMFGLWRADARLRATFDLRDPLHRRDFGRWFVEAGPKLGLEKSSTDAAAAILASGASLHHAPPRWEPQAAHSVPPDNPDVDGWLAEPIGWELGREPNGVPLPRMLALLWELRQDVRLHFPNRTRADALNYLAWCLTRGVQDGCVAVALTEPALAAFLDEPDPALCRETSRDGPPVTRLLRIMSALYDGPSPQIAREFPHTRRSRICMAIWACGTLRRRYGWPHSFISRPLRWLSEIAAATDDDAFMTLRNLLLGVWEISPDLQARFDLDAYEGRSALMDWFIREGAKKFEVEDRRSSTSSRLQPSRAAAPEFRAARDLCLVGYAGLISGRAEDLHMSALALSGHGEPHAILDRLSGVFTTEQGRSTASVTGPPGINLLHLNADTAFFDYLFLREKGIEKAYTIGCWAWELAKFPDNWKSSFAFVQEVWTASRFAYDAISPATTKPVLLMPAAVAVPLPEPGLRRSDFGLPDDKFIFYFSFDFRSYASRKNPLAVVAAFRRAFPDRAANAFLVLKTIGSAWRAEGRDNLIEAIGDDPRILMIDCELTRPRSIALLALSDCFVSLHRSEGFGRGPAEAMLLGKPVIVTDYSGTRDFATRETALPVGYELMPVGTEEYPGAKGQVWAEPDIEEAAASMRKIVDDAALAERLGKAGRARIRELYGPEIVGARYVERLEAIRRMA
jgi:glycosyltransferase involved in cell wall biosynthesis